MSKQFFWTLATLALLYFFYRVRIILTPFLFAILLAYILYPVVAFVEKKGASRVSAIFLVYLFLFVLFGTFLGVTLPKMKQELIQVMDNLPNQLGKWQELFSVGVKFFKKMELPDLLKEAATIVLERLEMALESLASRFMGIFAATLGNLFSLILSPILAFYLLRDHQTLKERSLAYIPASYRGEVRYLFTKINKAIGGFFHGQIIVCIFVGIFIYLGLFFLKVPQALVIATLAGVLDIIPYFGPVLGFIPAAIFSLASSPKTVVWILVLFVAANQIENGLISPYIIGDKVGLHPLVVIFAVLVGGHLMGITGMLLAIPIASIIRVLLQYFFLAKRQ